MDLMMVILSFHYLLLHSPFPSAVMQKDTRLAELKERLLYAENLDRERKNELHSLRRRFEILIQALQVVQTQQQTQLDDNARFRLSSGSIDANSSGIGNVSSTLSNLLQLSNAGRSRNYSTTSNGSSTLPIRFDSQFKLFLQNITDNAELQLPSFYSHFPHLSGKPESLVPAVKISKARTGVSLVFGIPTIKRPVQSYLIGMSSL